jgi:chloramphenicol-sensitive protein RarD
MQDQHAARRALGGALAAGTAYVLWGLFPLFWKQLKSVDATELIAHRVVWSLFFVLALTFLMKDWDPLLRALRSWRLIGLHLLSGGLLTINWLVYVWAVNHGRVIESSLGYFLVPLINVLMGRLVLREHLRPFQWLAIGIASVGVLMQAFGVGGLPWVAITLAISFGMYGLLRKRSPLGSLAGLSLETALYAPFAASFLLYRAAHGAGALGHSPIHIEMLVLSAGVVTAIPLLLFAHGARTLRLSTLGLLQYICPSIAFALGALVYGEPFDPARLLSFVLIWSALVLYTVDNLRAQARRVG